MLEHVRLQNQENREALDAVHNPKHTVPKILTFHKFWAYTYALKDWKHLEICQTIANNVERHWSA